MEFTVIFDMSKCYLPKYIGLRGIERVRKRVPEVKLDNICDTYTNPATTTIMHTLTEKEARRAGQFEDTNRITVRVCNEIYDVLSETIQLVDGEWGIDVKYNLPALLRYWEHTGYSISIGCDDFNNLNWED